MLDTKLKILRIDMEFPWLSHSSWGKFVSDNLAEALSCSVDPNMVSLHLAE